MSNGFQTAKNSIDLAGVNLSAFNEPISGGSFFDVGSYDVTVENAEVKDYGYGENLIITWTNAQDASIKQFINIFFTDRETGVKSLSKKYIVLSRIFASDLATRNKFFLEAALQDTTKFNAMKGLKAHIVVGKGKKGYEIVSDPTSGGYVVADVATKARMIDMVFPSMGEANQEAKDQGLKRAFNEVITFNAIDTEVATNERTLCTALEASETAAAPVALQQASML